MIAIPDMNYSISNSPGYLNTYDNPPYYFREEEEIEDDPFYQEREKDECMDEENKND